mgnify:CR=1 FL=1
MNLTITQENVHLLLPSKLSWMANMLAEDKGISIVEAMKMLYASEVYSRLEKESTKAWHLGTVVLYEDFQAGVRFFRINLHVPDKDASFALEYYSRPELIWNGDI